MCRDLPLNCFQDNIGGTDRNIDTELFKKGLVLRIPDAGYSAGYVEFMFGHLAGYQVILVVTGDRGHHVGTTGTHLSQGRCLTTVPAKTNAPHLLDNVAAQRFLFFQQEYFVPLIKQCFEQIITDPSAANNYNIHTTTSAFQLFLE